MTNPAPLFISHGAPTLLTGRSEANHALKAIGQTLATPRAYVVVSAHWEASPIRVTASRKPQTIHDFSGFGEELAHFEYPVQGDPELAGDIVGLLEAAGINAELNQTRGLDHGVWVPLALLKPAPDAPVLQVSLPARHDDDAQSLALALALAPLIDTGVQLIFSGAPTHSLRDAIGAPEDAPQSEFAGEFNSWVVERLTSGQSLNDWREAPHAHRIHPTPEHLRPLLAAATLGKARRLHHSWTHGALAMDVWWFEVAA